jgi:hypothetical protein
MPENYPSVISRIETVNMKKIEYIEGRKAMEHFEEGMKTLFNVPKAEVVSAKKKPKLASEHKPKKSDRD